MVCKQLFMFAGSSHSLFFTVHLIPCRSSSVCGLQQWRAEISIFNHKKRAGYETNFLLISLIHFISVRGLWTVPHFPHFTTQTSTYFHGNNTSTFQTLSLLWTVHNISKVKLQELRLAGVHMHKTHQLCASLPRSVCLFLKIRFNLHTKWETSMEKLKVTEQIQPNSWGCSSKFKEL